MCIRDSTAIMKEIQFHPTTDAPLHVDFYEVNDQKPIKGISSINGTALITVTGLSMVCLLYTSRCV